uniref:C2H2-type domain-containing protein n=1 Tax=Strigops habroptila TaxID=2489341 RepID=A0A672VDS4_STRHB
NRSGDATRKDLFTDTFCKVCRAVLQFESERTSHYKVGWAGFLLASTGALVCLGFVRSMDGSEVVDKNKYCSLCNVLFTSPVDALSHYLGKIHTKKSLKLTSSFFLVIGAGYYTCSICNVTLTSIETYQSHLQGKKHRIR